MIEKSKCHKLKLHYQNAMFWLFPDRRVSLTFEQVPAWFQKKQHFPVENLLVKNILTGWARDGNGGWVQEKELLRISAWVFCSVLLHPYQGLWGRSGAGNGTWTATHSQEHPLTELQNPIDLLCSSLCWGTNPDSNPEILWDYSTSLGKGILVVSCSAGLRGSRSCTPVCPCPFQAHSDLVLWSTDQFYQHSQNFGI